MADEWLTSGTLVKQAEEKPTFDDTEVLTGAPAQEVSPELDWMKTGTQYQEPLNHS